MEEVRRLKEEGRGKTEVYDLSGRKVSITHSQKSIYIVNGRKVLRPRV